MYPVDPSDLNVTALNTDGEGAGGSEGDLRGRAGGREGRGVDGGAGGGRGERERGRGEREEGEGGEEGQTMPFISCRSFLNES